MDLNPLTKFYLKKQRWSNRGSSRNPCCFIDNMVNLLEGAFYCHTRRNRLLYRCYVIAR